MLLTAESSDKERSDKHEGEVNELTPSSPLDTKSELTPSELLAIGLLRSRREAGLEKWRCLNVKEKATAQPPEAKNQSPSPLNSSPSGKTHSYSPPPEEPDGPEASQESYGGDWVAHFADELLPGGSSAVMSSPQNATAADQGGSSKGNAAMTTHQ
ncbi:hypothetical protein IWW34DRAFT_895389 [Fusarium oxysporum f. sp. albedinis]|nr:hypothetical protein IWW34DRAFT_895389 [Fusarium oxysporum f. sp. albedinis]